MHLAWHGMASQCIAPKRRLLLLIRNGMNASGQDAVEIDLAGVGEVCCFTSHVNGDSSYEQRGVVSEWNSASVAVSYSSSRVSGCLFGQFEKSQNEMEFLPLCVGGQPGDRRLF